MSSSGDESQTSASQTSASETNERRGNRSLVTGFIMAGVALLAFLFVFGSSNNSGGGDLAELGQFEFATADGGVTTLAVHSGEPMVINYFAGWCPPCRAELPDFEAVHQARGDEVTFYGISRDNSTDEWQNLVGEFGISYETVFEGNVEGSFAAVGALGMPTTVFVNADGDIAQVWSGILDEDTLNQLIDEHLS